MRLYLTSTGEWTGNQSDAAGLVRANGGTWEQIDVPTDKPGLIAWLTQQWARFSMIEAPSAPMTAPKPTRSERKASAGSASRKRFRIATFPTSQCSRKMSLGASTNWRGPRKTIDPKN